jgi:hypothetical protein
MLARNNAMKALASLVLGLTASIGFFCRSAMGSLQGKRAVLAAHSPAKLFSAAITESLVGRSFDFAITQSVDNSRTSHSALKAINSK